MSTTMELDLSLHSAFSDDFLRILSTVSNRPVLIPSGSNSGRIGTSTNWPAMFTTSVGRITSADFKEGSRAPPKPGWMIQYGRWPKMRCSAAFLALSHPIPLWITATTRPSRIPSKTVCPWALYFRTFLRWSISSAVSMGRAATIPISAR